MRAAAVFSLLACLVHVNTQSDQERRHPHIIFILTDDQGYNDIGYHNPTIKTPTLDKLAAEGVKLENYYVQPICTPSRSQLLTGRYQIHTGLQHSIIRPSQPSCLPAHMDTLPERLQRAGYATHMVGKWHLGFYSYGSCDGPGVCGYDLHDNESVAWGHTGKYSTHLFTQRARKILENHNPESGPLFLLLSLQAVHTPLQPPKSYIYPYHDMANVARRKFAAMVSTVDEAVRNVTYALRKHGYYRNSVIIYSTDNGAQPFTGGSNWPLRGRKGTYWEGGLRGVAFVHSPLLKRRRRVSSALLHITDWFPTLVSLAGGNISQSEGLDGFDVWDTLSEGKDSPRQEILHNIDPLHRPSSPSSSWDANIDVSEGKLRGAGGKSGLHLNTPKRKKSKKKKILKLQLKQKSRRYSAKAIKRPRLVAHHAAGLKSKSTPKLEHHSKSRLKPKSGSPGYPQNQSRGPQLNLSGPLHPKSFKTKSWPNLSQTQNQSPSPPKPPREISSQHQNQSASKPPQPKFKSRPTSSSSSLSSSNLSTSPPTASSPLSQPVWDTSVQAAIRVGDWKLLTGDPGHGDWVPPQVLPTLPGRWWNLERVFQTTYRTAKNIWLFNITADPYERRDLANRWPDVVQHLLARLAHYNRTAVPVYFPLDDPQANPDRNGGAWVPWVEEEEKDQEQGKFEGIIKKGKNSSANKKRKKEKCRLCKLKSFFLKLNTGMMSNRI